MDTRTPILDGKNIVIGVTGGIAAYKSADLAVFAFHGGIRFAAGDGRDCPLALHRDLAGSLLDDGPPPGQWAEIWHGHRPSLPREVIRLYRPSGD